MVYATSLALTLSIEALRRG